MELAGLPYEVIVSDVDETVTGEPDAQVRELALRKGLAVRDMILKDDPKRDSFVIVAADTLVFINGEALGKPKDRDEAFEMLDMLQGRRHVVYTGVAIVQPDTEYAFVEWARVFFRPLSHEEINAYIDTGEPFDKAGAYGIQERGAVFLDRIEGDFYTVVGLPISRVYSELAKLGYGW